MNGAGARGEARRIYEAALRSDWDTYRGAIAAAETGNAARLIDCLRGRKPLLGEDSVRLADYIASRVPRRRWPPGLAEQLLHPTDEDFDHLAHLIEQIGRCRGRQRAAPVHEAARLAEVLLTLLKPRLSTVVRDAVIAYACEAVSAETAVPIEIGPVRDLLDREKRRRRHN